MLSRPRARDDTTERDLLARVAALEGASARYAVAVARLEATVARLEREEVGHAASGPGGR